VASVGGCVPDGILASDRQMIAFGNVAVSTTSPATAIQISNVGRGPTGQITPAITGPDAAEFVTANGCTSLDAMGTCTITVSFKPISAGAKTGSVSIESSPGGTLVLPLSGTATP
jgi:hypothetical protein